MTEREIVRCINEGANYYLRLFGDAAHMEYHKRNHYSFIQPKQGEHGVRFAFDVRLEDLTKQERLAKISEIKALSMPVWWDLQASYGLYKLIFGKERSVAAPANGDELYMAILPGEQVDSEHAAGLDIRKVETPAAFAEWAAAVNGIMFGGTPDIHPENHWHLCEKGLINCFACYDGGHAVSFASVLDNEKT